MKTDRRRLLFALSALPLATLAGRLCADTPDSLERARQRGALRIAVYTDYPPYAFAGKGIDVDLGRAIAARLGLAAEIAWFNADEDMNDDLRNMVWKGHYLGTQPADLMMHVPVDEGLARANDRVRIFGGYHRESLAVARQPSRVPPLSGSAAVALDVFTREKVGVEIDSLADSFLLSALGGRLRDNVVHYRTVGEAAAALTRDEVAAVLAPRAELEAALPTPAPLMISPVNLAELKVNSWPLGMAVKAQDTTLQQAVETALNGLLQDGTVARIFSNYGITHERAA